MITDNGIGTFLIIMIVLVLLWLAQRRTKKKEFNDVNKRRKIITSRYNMSWRTLKPPEERKKERGVNHD
jgi:hypothetical protein